MRAHAALAALLKQLHACRTNRVRRIQLPLETRFIQAFHPVASRLILHRPEAHDDRSHARNLQRTPHAEYTFTRGDLAKSGIAGREHRPLGALQVESGNLFGVEDAAALTRTRQRVDPGERESREDQRVVDGDGGASADETSDAARRGKGSLALP